MSDIFDPINHDIDQLLDRSLHWIDVPAGRQQQSQQTRHRQMSRQQQPQQHLQQQQQQHRQSSLPKQHKLNQPIMPHMLHTQKQQQQVQCKMPQKFRILIDCSDCDPKTLKTHIKTVNNQKHLIVCADDKKTKKIKCDTTSSKKKIDITCTTKFKRTYTLPKQVEVNKMISFVTPNGQFVVEFPLQEVPCCLDIDMVPKIEKNEEGRKCVSLRVPIPKSVDPAKVTLTVKGCEVILRFEERFGMEDCVSRVYFYNRCMLPEIADLTRIKCSADKHRLIITCPLQTDSKMWQAREIPIQRKIRHKTLLASGGDTKMSGSQSITQKQQKKDNMSSSSSKITSRSKSPITSEQKKSSINKTDQQKQKSPTKSDQKQKSPIKDIHESSNIDKKQKKKTTTTGTTGDEKTGSDILKSVFGSGQSDKDKKQSDKDKKNKSSGEQKPEFPLLPTDLPTDGKPSETHHQQQ